MRSKIDQRTKPASFAQRARFATPENRAARLRVKLSSGYLSEAQPQMTQLPLLPQMQQVQRDTSIAKIVSRRRHQCDWQMVFPRVGLCSEALLISLIAGQK